MNYHQLEVIRTRGSNVLHDLNLPRLSARTKAALAAAKERGQVLGKNGAILAAKNKADAVERVVRLVPILSELKERGLSMRKMVADLNERGIPSAAGGQWHLANLDRALKRLKDGEEMIAYRLDPSRPYNGLFGATAN